MDNENTTEILELERVKRAVQVLAEHFDTVQIFTTKMDDNQADTKHYRYGSGNWFARYGQIKIYIADTEKGAGGTYNDNDSKW